jgi:Acyltransferase family
MTHGSMRMQARPLAATSQPTAPPAQVPQQPSPRIPFLDWLRVLALVGVFLYHAVHPFDTLDWHVKNADQTQLITGLLVFFSAWGLGLFFLLAGAGACLSLRSRSAGGYAAERLSRLLVPLVVAWVLLAPLQGFIEARHQGWWDGSFRSYLRRFFDEATQWAMSWPGRPHPMVLFWSGHLWFLVMLLWFAFLALPSFLRGSAQRPWRDGPLDPTAAPCACPGTGN